jgi:antitoxin HicB
MLAYPISLTPDTNGTLLVSFPDIPEANSVGVDERDATENAADSLETALGIYFDERRSIPMPSKPAANQLTVALSALSSAKVLLWNEMVAQKLRKADLARLLGVDLPQVDLLFDLAYSSQIEFVAQAASALGKTLTVDLT